MDNQQPPTAAVMPPSLAYGGGDIDAPTPGG
jgi:hypothetical protein